VMRACVTREFLRNCGGHEQCWKYWASKARSWPKLALVVLLLLSAPIGNSDLERSLRLAKTGSLDPVRQSAAAENKSLMNLSYCNGFQDFYNLGPELSDRLSGEKQ
jgi:hypothetical protein